MAMARPFHRTIVTAVSALSSAGGFSGQLKREYAQIQLNSLAELTRATAIPENHDKITVAFRKADERVNGEKTAYVEAAIGHIQKEKRRHIDKK